MIYTLNFRRHMYDIKIDRTHDLSYRITYAMLCYDILCYIRIINFDREKCFFNCRWIDVVFKKRRLVKSIEKKVIDKFKLKKYVLYLYIFTIIIDKLARKIQVNNYLIIIFFFEWEEQELLQRAAVNLVGVEAGRKWKEK